MRQALVAFILVLTAASSAFAQPLTYPPSLAFLTTEAGFPVDQGAAPGTARAAWQDALSAETQVFLLANTERLEREARRGRINAASWAMLRTTLLEFQPTPSANPNAFIRRFEREQILVARMFEALPPPTTLSEDLFRRNARRDFLGYTEFRRNEVNTNGFGQRLSEIDMANMAHLTAALGDRDWVDDAIDGPGAQVEAWAIVQHNAWEPTAQLAMLQRMLGAAEAGRAPSAFAMEWDRHAVWQQRPQRYSLMLRCWRGDYIATGGIEDSENVDERRALFGLRPWAEDHEEARARYTCPPNAPLGSQELAPTN